MNRVQQLFGARKNGLRTAMVLMDAVLRQRARVAAPCRTLGDLGHGEGTTAKRLATPEDRRGKWNVSKTEKNGTRVGMIKHKDAM